MSTTLRPPKLFVTLRRWSRAGGTAGTPIGAAATPRATPLDIRLLAPWAARRMRPQDPLRPEHDHEDQEEAVEHVLDVGDHLRGFCGRDRRVGLDQDVEDHPDHEHADEAARPMPLSAEDQGDPG